MLSTACPLPEHVKLRARFSTAASGPAVSDRRDVYFCVAPFAPHPEGLLFPDPRLQRLLLTPPPDWAADAEFGVPKGPVPRNVSLERPFCGRLPGESQGGVAVTLAKVQLRTDAAVNVWVFVAVAASPLCSRPAQGDEESSESDASSEGEASSESDESSDGDASTEGDKSSEGDASTEGDESSDESSDDSSDDD